MKAVHFGAGNIGRGFVGLILHRAGYEIVFADVATELIAKLAASSSYEVHEVGAEPRTWTVDGYRAINSRDDEAGVIAEIATAEVVTTAVGPNVLRFIAPVIAKALEQRADDAGRLTVMACENAINATDLLAAEVAKALGDRDAAWLHGRAVFANTAVDRIVPGQADPESLDVTVEDFFEWAIETSSFDGDVPVIPDAHFVPDLEPYIERKLFTVNTGHATTAYHGFLAGAATLAEAIAIPAVRAEVEAVLAETADLLVRKHLLDQADHDAYVERTLVRFANADLPDTPERVGREPLRKLGRNERFVSPARQIAERGGSFDALVRAMGAAVQFDVPEDRESVELQALLRSEDADTVTERVTGIDSGSPLFAAVSTRVSAVQADL
ncbi:mannitol-1-phosphate 5-dehydrogenase [Marisediminicola sp. LYQ134]|uniref:mannitol-1-phosphate 5-dehydrogenase n=1 Tax=Marisediminicola sp. LYQ134 TaxID=3391061 RepID=UPI003983DA17